MPLQSSPTIDTTPNNPALCLAPPSAARISLWALAGKTEAMPSYSFNCKAELLTTSPTMASMPRINGNIARKAFIASPPAKLPALLSP